MKTIKNKNVNLVLLVLYFFIVSIPIIILFKPTENLLLESDFLNHFVAAKIVKDGKGEKLYDIGFNYQIQEKYIERTDVRNRNGFRLIPASVIIFLPFSFLHPLMAYKYFVYTNYIILVLTSVWLSIQFRDLVRGKPFLGLIPIVFLPVLLSLRMGQTSVILLLLYASLYFLLKKKKWFLLAMLLILSVSLYISGWQTLQKYPEFVLSSEIPKLGSNAALSFTFYGFLLAQNMISKMPREFLIAANLIFYLLALVIFRYRYKEVDREKSFISAVLFSIFFSMHTLAHDLTVTLIPIFIILNLVFLKKEKRKYVSQIIVFFLFFLPSIIFLNTTYFLQFAFLMVGLFFLFPGSRSHEEN